jgi:hypothetical protein
LRMMQQTQPGTVERHARNMNEDHEDSNLKAAVLLAGGTAVVAAPSPTLPLFNNLNSAHLTCRCAVLCCAAALSPRRTWQHTMHSSSTRSG